MERSIRRAGCRCGGAQSFAFDRSAQRSQRDASSSGLSHGWVYRSGRTRFLKYGRPAEMRPTCLSATTLGCCACAHFRGHDIVLMRGHGSTVIGHSIKQAVYRAVLCRTQRSLPAPSHAMGEVTFLTPGKVRPVSEHRGAGPATMEHVA